MEESTSLDKIEKDAIDQNLDNLINKAKTSKKRSRKLKCSNCFQIIRKNNNFCNECGMSTKNLLFERKTDCTTIELDKINENETKIILSPQNYVKGIPQYFPQQLTEPVIIFFSNIKKNAEKKKN